MDYETFTRELSADIRTNGRPTSGPMEGRPLMILTTTGAKSGAEHQAIVNYLRDGDRYIVAATKSGSPTNPAWYHNLVAHPQATVEAHKDKFRAQATIATGTERDRLWDKVATEFPYFQDYPSMTDRVIPVITLDRIG